MQCISKALNIKYAIHFIKNLHPMKEKVLLKVRSFLHLSLKILLKKNFKKRNLKSDLSKDFFLHKKCH